MKIAIVAPDKEDLMVIPSLNLGGHDIHVYTLHTNINESSYPIYIFEQIPDMPGYMRGIESYMENIEFVIGIEASRLATFQGSRIADKLGVPFLAYSSEKKFGYYNEYRNIEAIRADTFYNADEILAASSMTQKLLSHENDSPCRVLPPMIDPRFKFEYKRRVKFRDHIGLAADDYVVIYETPLTAKCNDVIDALHLCKSSKNIVLIFVGDGEGAHELKHHVINLNLGDKVKFIHEDTSPYIKDLYSAGDAYLEADLSETNEGFPYGTFNALGSGNLPIIPISSPAHSYLSNIALTIQTTQITELSDAFKTAAESKTSKDKIIDFSKQFRLSSFDITRYKNTNLDVDLDTESLTYKEQIESCKSRLEDPNSTIKDKAILNFQIGKCYMHLMDFENAVNSLQTALDMDRNMWRAFMLLGDISLQSHSHEEAITFYKKVLAVEPENPSALLGIGVIHQRLGLFEHSLHWYERSIMASADSPQKAIQLLIQASHECYDKNSVIHSLKSVNELYPEDSGVLLSLGQAYVEIGDAHSGNELIEKAIAIQNRESVPA